MKSAPQPACWNWTAIWPTANPFEYDRRVPTEPRPYRSCQRLRLRCLNGVMVRIPRARAKNPSTGAFETCQGDPETSAFFVRSPLDKLDFLGSFDDHPQQQHAMAPAPDVGFAPHALLVSHWQVDDLQIVLGGSKQ